MTHTPPDTSADDLYFLEIEAAFAGKRNTPFVFSAKDWALMKSWKDEGIPLAIVLEAMATAFEKQAASGRRKVISSLSYCRYAVKELWNERRDLHVGASGNVPEANPQEILTSLSERLSQIAEQCDGPMRDLLRSAAASVQTAASAGGVPQIEEALMTMEEKLLGDLAAVLPEAERSRIEEEINEQLSGFESSGADVLQKTRDANLKRLLRRRFSIPRLSLFG